jgi:hypothetical protein
MLNLTFSDSAAGSLRFLHRRLPGEQNPADILPLWMVLDVGDLSNSETRQAVYHDLYSYIPEVPEEMAHMNRQALERLDRASAAGEAVRLWLCPSDPSELCALLFLCDRYADTAPKLSVIRIPDRVMNEDAQTVTTYRSSGELPPEAMITMLSYEQPLSDTERRAYALEWRQLVKENAPLRAVVNGRLMSVPDEFYDHTLRANLPEGTFTAAWPIGKTLSMVPGVGDRWLYMRLMTMVRAGELVEVAPSTDDHPYSGTFRKSSPNS